MRFGIHHKLPVEFLLVGDPQREIALASAENLPNHMLWIYMVLVEEKFLAKIAFALWILFEDLLGVVSD